MSQNPTPDQYPGEAPNPGLQPQPVPQSDDGLTPEERDQRQRDRLTEGTQPEGVVDGTDSPAE